MLLPRLRDAVQGESSSLSFSAFLKLILLECSTRYALLPSCFSPFTLTSEPRDSRSSTWTSCTSLPRTQSPGRPPCFRTKSTRSVSFTARPELPPANAPHPVACRPSSQTRPPRPTHQRRRSQRRLRASSPPTRPQGPPRGSHARQRPPPDAH